MPKLQRTSPLLVIACGVAGAVLGLLLQLVRSSIGRSPLVPPISLAATLVVFGVILIVLGVLLRRAITRTDRRAVNPFHAVRLLAAAKAGQCVGALFAGFGAGLLLQLLGRTVAAPLDAWLPMLFALVGGLVLVAGGVIAELMCRVPPSGDAEETDEGAGDGQGVDQPV